MLVVDASLRGAPVEVIMKRLSACLLVAASLALAESPKLPEDVDEIVLLDGARVGSRQVSVKKDDSKGERLRVTSSLELNLRRFDKQIRLRMDQGTVETLEGKVLGVFMKQNP